MFELATGKNKNKKRNSAFNLKNSMGTFRDKNLALFAFA